MIILPEQLYVGIRPQAEGENQLPLGFATPFGTDKAFEKRKKTVDSWTGSSRHQTVTGNKPRFEVLDNALLDGYRISQSVRRYGWNGGNVVWRIEDPRGFELEISSSNFASIVDCVTLTSGAIEGKCIWGREGATNVLLPEASAPYQEAVKTTNLSKLSVSSKDMKPGQFVQMKDGRVAMFCGEFFTLVTERGQESRPDLELPSEDRWRLYPKRVPQTPFYSLKPKVTNKHALFMLEEHVDGFLTTGTLPLKSHSPDYWGFSDCMFSYSGFKNVAKLEARKIDVDQAKIISLLEADKSSVSPLGGSYATLISTTKFKEAAFTVVEEEHVNNIKIGSFLKSPDGQLHWVFYHTFHEMRYPLNFGSNNDQIYIDLMPVELEKFGLNVEQKAIGTHTVYPATANVLEGWKAVTIYVTSGGRTAPMKVSSYYSKHEKSIFEVVPSKKRG